MLCDRDATGKFPEFPEEDDGGSAVIFKEKDPEEVEKELKEKVGAFDNWCYVLHHWFAWDKF
jgi:hypothetical protein